MRQYHAVDYPDRCHECGEGFRASEQRLGVIVARGTPEGPVAGLGTLYEARSFHLRHAPPPGSPGQVLGGANDRRRRIPQYGPDHFAGVALVYREGLTLGHMPTKHVAETFSVSRSTAAKWVIRARQLGLLGATERGRAGA